jgi:predicted dehydrogenase
MLKIGVLGAGHLGKIHIKLLKELSDYFSLVGFYDISDEQAKITEDLFNLKRFNSIDSLLEEVDCVDIVTPTNSHYACAFKAINKKKHIFLEKPVTQTIEEAKSLIEISKNNNLKIQVGHVERFNPAFTFALKYINNPMFIETHRLAQFNSRGTDVSVILDLMIHDLDIILSVVNSDIKQISASGVAVVSDTPDITNVRIEFENGCVANLTASRISMKNMRKSRFFQKDAYISIDFLSKEFEVLRLETIEGEPNQFDIVFDPKNGKPAKKVFFDKPKLSEVNAIKEELKEFAIAIKNDKTPIVSIEDGYKALLIAHQIIEKIDLNNKIDFNNL